MNPNNDTPSIRFAGFTDLPAGRQALGKWCVYVLECDDGSLYKGKTNDLIRRISEHMKGHGAEHTQKHKPVKLVYFEAFKSEKEALEKEKYLKTGSGREWLKVHLQKYLPLDYSRELEYDHYAWEQRRL
ncbi:MAG: GIY-YIG nuclease family protein, partial [Clostridia bacterium]|nr:GIY-YIG nuclease family protein [Clostridia bacterium]